MNKNNSGFGSLVVLLAILSIILAGAVGWLVYNRNSNDAPGISQSTEQQSPTTNSTTPASGQDKNTDSDSTTSNKYYSITLPNGWAEVIPSETISAQDKFKYKNSSEEKELLVLVNPGGFGVANDFIGYQVLNNKITIDINKIEKCNEEPPCKIIKGRVDLTSSAKPEAKINGNNYIFMYKDAKTDSTDSLNTLKKLLSSIQFN